jgi:hypothetical protein
MKLFCIFKTMAFRKIQGKDIKILLMRSIPVQIIIATLIVVFISTSCDHKKETENLTSRTYRMGFQNSAPRPDFNLVMQSLDLWIPRSDAAIITTEVPWDSLYAGVSPKNYVLNNYKGLVDYYRTKNLKLWVYIDPANGMDRTSDATALVTRSKSIAQTDVQLLYRRFALVMDSILKPDHLGLALETNLIRSASSSAIYQGVIKAANDAAQEIRAFDSNIKLSISVQADCAWGKTSNNTYIGIAQDFIDFPFIQELGISSYPYFYFDNPTDIPLNYYTKLVEGKPLPVFVSEGGWSSETVTSFTDTPQKQKDYITRQGQLLDEVGATAYFQLTFTDVDLSALPAGTPSNINLFAYTGLVDKDLQPKPALDAWDALFKRALVQ